MPGKKKQVPSLGDEVLDLVTGMEGILIGMTTFLHGCVRVGIQPPVRDGKVPEAYWCDLPQVEIIRPKVIPIGDRKAGGPMVSIPTRNKS